MKKFLSLCALLVFAISSTVYAQTASDIGGYQNETAIKHLYDNGIVEGYPDGTFKPDKELVRAELMKILVLGAGYNPSSEEYSNCFPDVKDEWFARYVCFAKEKGWVQGYPDGNFAPGVNVNKVEAIKMLLEIFKVELSAVTTDPYKDTPSTDWYGQYIWTAKERGLLEEAGSNYYPGMYIKRGQVSENIYRLLMDEQDSFHIAAEKAMCDYFYFGDHDIVTTPLEEANPLLRENLIDNGFVIKDNETFNAITSRYSYKGNEFLTDPASVCEN